ncbi:MAG: hypothetical protein AABM32_10050 [Chloroflexota bacterium]
MNRQSVTKRCTVALGLAILFMVIAVPGYAIAEEIQRARADRPDPVQIGQPRLPSAGELVTDVPTSVLRLRDVRVQSVPASGPVPDEVPSSVRREPVRLGP